MSLEADSLLDRIRLRQQVGRWRTATIGIAALAIILLFINEIPLGEESSDHIAQVTIEDIILDDSKRDALFEDIAEDDSVKAVFVRIDSPGGTAVGGEELYLSIRKMAKKKPVVILMRTLCTSAGYMAALGGDYILAREGSVTGSIGVILQGVEVTDMMAKIGVNPIIFKSGPNKASPNPMEKVSDANREVMDGVVQDFYRFFVELVKERRGISDEKLAVLADGRVFTGRQALKEDLVDALGGEEEARAWLKKTHKIDADLEVHDWKVEDEIDSLLEKLSQSIDKSIFSIETALVGLDGLTLIWQPAVQH